VLRGSPEGEPVKLWDELNTGPRHRVDGLTRAGISRSPGVYALYRDGAAVYVGKAKRLDDRLRAKHFGRGRSMTNSALRRNVAELLGIASAKA
jgi:hypothetical protein